MKAVSNILIAAASLLAVSCGPLTYSMTMELRRPSTSGYDFSGKSMGIVYVHGAEPGDSTFSAAFAEGLAEGLEADYFNGETTIPLYTLPYESGSDYRSKDTLVSLILDLDKDVVLLYDEPKYSETDTSILLYVMDSHDKTDTVKAYRIATADRSYSLAVEGGKTIASHFTPQWDREDHVIYFYDNDAWLEAADLAADGKFKDAMEKWLDLVGTGSSDHRASAAYDIAFCCYMMQDFDMCNQWLAIADRYCELPRTGWLRRRAINRGGKL